MITTFILLVLSVMFGTLLASGVALVIMLNPKVMKKFTKYYTKLVEDIVDDLEQ